jgi:hypothetical protein
MEHIHVTNINEHLDKNPAPAPASDNSDTERLEVTSSWFSVKLEEINGYTLTAIAMILVAMVAVVWIVSN